MRSSHATITITFEGNVSCCLRTILNIFGQIRNIVGHFWSVMHENVMALLLSVVHTITDVNACSFAVA